MSLLGGTLQDILYYVKENEIHKAESLLNDKIQAVWKMEVMGTRQCIDEINRSINQINIEMKKLTLQYRLIKDSFPAAMLHSIDEYIYELKKRKAILEIKKHRM